MKNAVVDQKLIRNGMIDSEGRLVEPQQKTYVDAVTWGLNKLLNLGTLVQLASVLACIPTKCKANVAKKLLKDATTVVTNGFNSSRAFIEHILLKTNLVSSMNFYSKDGDLKTPDTKGGFIVNILAPELFEKVGALAIKDIKVSLIKTYLGFDKNSVEPRTPWKDVQLNAELNYVLGVMRIQEVSETQEFTKVYYCVGKFDVYGNLLDINSSYNVGEYQLIEADTNSKLVEKLVQHMSDSDSLLDLKPLTSGKTKKEGVRKVVNEEAIKEATESQEVTDEEASTFVESLDQTEEV